MQDVYDKKGKKKAKQELVFVNESGSTFIPKDAVIGWSDEKWESRNSKKDKDGKTIREFV